MENTDVMLTELRTLRLIASFGRTSPADVVEFYEAFGELEYYSAYAVLSWLGL